MQKQRVILIIGIVLALIAVFMTKVYLDQQHRLAQQTVKEQVRDIQQNQVAVLVAKRDITRGATIDADMLEVVVVPVKYVQPGAVTSLDTIAGMAAVAGISKGEQITRSKLSQTRQPGGLAEATPIGKRAITISVDNIAALAGMIKPGDYVDVIALVPVPVTGADGKPATQAAAMPLFQNVLVIAVGQQTGSLAAAQEGTRYAKPEEKRESSPLITLALLPQEANFLAFLQEQSKIRLIMRNPADPRLEPVQPAMWNNLMQFVLPQTGQKENTAVSESPAEGRPTVEIYRGLNKEKVPLK